MSDQAEYEYYLERAEFCLRTGMSPEYYDNMPLVEHSAWIAAYNKIQKERGQ